jgi:hypothetical protein
MRLALKILGSREGRDVPALSHLLDALGPEGAGMAWSVFHLTAGVMRTGPVPGGLASHALVDLQALSREPTGVRLSWPDLRALAARVEPIRWGTFAAVRDPGVVPNYRTDPGFRSSDLVLEAVDGSYWEVYTAERRLAERLAAAFPGRVRYPQEDPPEPVEV